MTPGDVRAELHKPIAQELLLRAGQLAYLGYDCLDGSPRVISIGIVWRSGGVIACTAANAPKVAALRARPRVALTIDTSGLPPRLLLLRGAASVEIVEGVPDEYLEASRKGVGSNEWDGFEASVRSLYDSMARISVKPDLAKLIDFETTLPQAVDELVRRKALDRSPAEPA